MFHQYIINQKTDTIKANKITVDNLTLSTNNRLVPKGNVRYTDENNTNKVEVIKLTAYNKDKEELIDLVTPEGTIYTLRYKIYINKLESGNIRLYTGDTKYSIIKDELINIFKSGNHSDNLLTFFESARYYANKYEYTEKQYIALIHFNLGYIFKRLDKEILINLFSNFKHIYFDCYQAVELLNKKYKISITQADLPIIAVTLGTKLYQSFLSNPNRIIEILKVINLDTANKITRYNDYICTSMIYNITRMIENK